MSKQTEQIVKSAMRGDVVTFKETVNQVLAGKAKEALDIQRIQTGLNILSPKE